HIESSLDDPFTNLKPKRQENVFLQTPSNAVNYQGMRGAVRAQERIWARGVRVDRDDLGSAQLAEDYPDTCTTTTSTQTVVGNLPIPTGYYGRCECDICGVDASSRIFSANLIAHVKNVGGVATVANVDVNAKDPDLTGYTAILAAN